MKRTTKLLAMILSACMLFAFLPMVSFADAPGGWAVYNDTDKTLTFCTGTQSLDGIMRDGETVPVAGDAYYNGFLTEEYSNASSVPWCSEASEIQTVIFLDDIKPASTAYWFNGFSSLSSFTDIEKLNTSEVTDMSYMFCDCSGLTALDLSSFDTAAVENMWNLFSGCAGLKELNLSSFNTVAVSTTKGMFSGCSNLSTLTLGSEFYFMSLDAALPNPPENDSYTGKWILQTDPTLKFSAGDLVRNYDPATMAGTWIWEKYIPLADAEVTVADALYTGEAITPEVTVVLDGKTLEKDVDYTVDYSNNIEPGTATVTITAIGDCYKGEVIKTFKITKPLTDVKIDVSVKNDDYTGEPKTPDVTVTLPDGTVLVKDVDYTVTYVDNDKPGIAKVIITGIGDYSGTAEATFEITEPSDSIKFIKQQSIFRILIEFLKKIFAKLASIC